MIAIYLRVSTNKQEDRAQHHKIKTWCKAQNYPAARTEIYSDDGISGKTIARRPAFKKLLADIEAGKVKKVITFESSRLSRNQVDLMNIMRIFGDNGCVLEVPGVGVKPFGTALEQFLMSVEGFVSQKFLEDHGARVSAGIAARRARDPSYQHGNKPGTKFPHRARPTATPKNLEQIRLCREAGMNTRQIAQVVGVSQSSISRIIRSHLA